MQFLLDYLPIIAFFIAYKLADIYVATMVAMVLSVLQVIVLKWRTGKVGPIPLLSLVLIVVFGGLTLLLQDEWFIKWKPTILYVAMAVALLIAFFVMGYNPLKSLINMAQFQCDERVWPTLTIMWSVFFVFMAVANLVVAYAFSTDTWVNYKLFGSLLWTLLFVIAQAMYLSKHAINPTDEDQST